VTIPGRPEPESLEFETLAMRRDRFSQPARQLAERIVGEVDPFVSSPRTSKKAQWFAAHHDDVLVVVVGTHENPNVMDEILAYALAWQGDRDLVLVLPIGYESVTLARLAWIDGCIRVFVYGPENVPVPAVIPSRAETIEAAKDRHREDARSHALGEGEELILELLTWARENPLLQESTRVGYVTWKCAGLQVLRASRRGGRIDLIAGVDYKGKLPHGAERAIDRTVTADDPLRPEEAALMKERIIRAVGRRMDPTDVTYLEHRLQANLEGGVLSERLGLSEAWPEYPVWRGQGNAGFIDFLALDDKGRLHLVETKVDPDDVTVMLQALDYAVWVLANEASIRSRNGWSTPESPQQLQIHLICAPVVKARPDGTVSSQKRIIGRYLSNQLEVLSKEFKCHVWLVDDPRAVPPRLTGPFRAPPYRKGDESVGKPVQPQRWLPKANATLVEGRRQLFGRVEDAALPAALGEFHKVFENGRDHRWILSVRSSQAMALNLFGPVDNSALSALFELMGINVIEANPLEFEYIDPQDRLAERRPGHERQTQVDVFMRGTDADGKRIAALIEVKFTEEFGHCSAYDSEHNDARSTCRSVGLFGGDAAQCFQLRNHGEGRRRYDQYLVKQPVVLPSGGSDDGGCLVRRQLSQPARNLAFGHLLVEAGELDRFVYAVCAPARFESAWRRVAELGTAFPDTGERQVRTLSVEAVQALHPDGGAAFRAFYRGLIGT
jgi:hypothetical protein